MLYEIFDCITSFLICYLFYYAGQSAKSSMCFLYDLFVLPFSIKRAIHLLYTQKPPPPAFIFLQKYFPHLIFIKLSFSQLFQSFQSGFCPYQRMLKWFQSKAKVMVWTFQLFSMNSIHPQYFQKTILLNQQVAYQFFCHECLACYCSAIKCYDKLWLALWDIWNFYLSKCSFNVWIHSIFNYFSAWMKVSDYQYEYNVTPSFELDYKNSLIS